MTKSRASAEGEDHLHEFQLLKQDVQDNQHEISAMRADLSTVGAKQDQIHRAMDGMQTAVEDLNLQMAAMADTLKTLRAQPLAPQQPPQQGIPAEDCRPPTPAADVDANTLLQKKLEVDALRRQYAYEQEMTRHFQ
jgi:hypothetical protein